jgi:DNA-binding transcriptional ArsR family regulator
MTGNVAIAMRQADDATRQTGELRGDADISVIGALLADRTRCQVLLALLDGRALPASVLADEAGVAPSTASGHLARLTDAGLLTAERYGRHRYYRLAGPEVAAVIETLARLAPSRPVRSLREGSRAARLRAARSCYDHLAGRLGVQVMATILERGYLAGGDGLFHPREALCDQPSAFGRDVDYSVTDAGLDFFGGLGIGPFAGLRAVRYCVDWTEQRHHLAGEAGRAVLDLMLDRCWLVRDRASRAMRVTEAGLDGLREVFQIDWK